MQVGHIGVALMLVAMFKKYRVSFMPVLCCVFFAVALSQEVGPLVRPLPSRFFVGQDGC